MQSGVLRSGLFQDRNSGISTLPQREEIFVGTATVCSFRKRVHRHGLSRAAGLLRLSSMAARIVGSQYPLITVFRGKLRATSSLIMKPVPRWPLMSNSITLAVLPTESNANAKTGEPESEGAVKVPRPSAPT